MASPLKEWEEVFEHLFDAVVVTDTDLERPGPRIVYVNRAFEELTGYGRGEIIGLSPRFLQGEQTDCATLARLRASLREGKPFHGKVTNYRKDGSSYSVEWNCLAIPSAPARPEYFVGLQRDATGQVDARRLLRAVQELDELVAILSPGGQIILANRAFDAYTDAGAEAIDEALTFVHAEAQADFRERLASGSPWYGDIEIRSPAHPGPLTLSCSLSSLITHGKTRDCVLVARNVTEHRRVERIAAALNMTHNVGYVFAGIRHELGNPVNSVKAALTVLRSRVDTMDADSLRSYVDDLLEETRRMEFLLQALRGFSNFEDVKLEPISLLSYLERFVRLVERDAESKGALLRIRVPPKCRAMADPRALHHVLINLVTNAIDTVRDQPRRQVTLRAESQGATVRITVRDTGCGMSQRQLQQLFQPFQSTKPSGTGLGLVIVQRLVAHMNGTVDVRSDIGEGTEFVVTLDAADG